MGANLISDKLRNQQQSNKAKNKDKYLIGKQMFSDVMLLHEADVKGH